MLEAEDHSVPAPARRRTAAAVILAAMLAWLGVALGMGTSAPTFGSSTDLRDGRGVAGTVRQAPTALVQADRSSVSTAAPPEPDPASTIANGNAAPSWPRVVTSLPNAPWRIPAAEGRTSDQPRAPPSLQA